MDMFCQELERQLMNQLNRPECLKDTFVNPDVQCPPKQRGRKKKATPASSTKEHMGRPSAAACGFSTQGMTDQEVHEKLAKQRKATEDDEESPPTTAKRTRKSKATAKSMASGRPKKAKRTRKSKDYDHESNENPPAKAKRTRKSKASGDDEKKEIPPTNPEPKSTASGHDTIDQAGEPCSTSTASHVLEAEEHAPTTGPTDPQAEEQQESNGPTGSTDDVDDDRMSTVAAASAAGDARAEAKARYSRKSAAYHRAVKAAKNRGCTDAEAKAAGKVVS